MQTMTIFHRKSYDWPFCNPRNHTPDTNGTDRNIPRSEEELPVEIRLLNSVHVSHSHLSPLSASQTNHSKVLQQLTANGTSTNLRERGKKCQQVAWMDIPRNWKIMSTLTRKYFCWLSLTCNSLPNTAICPSYRQCFYWGGKEATSLYLFSKVWNVPISLILLINNHQ